MTYPSWRVVVLCRMSSRTALGGWARGGAAACCGGNKLRGSITVLGFGNSRSLSRSLSPGQLMKTRRCASEGAAYTTNKQLVSGGEISRRIAIKTWGYLRQAQTDKSTIKLLFSGERRILQI